jgi:mannose-6-phosphate isomerase-like protein (cupin superfamily)
VIVNKELREAATPPWGKWEVLLSEPGYKVKRITVKSGQRLSYQKHAMRQEHWVAVAGEGIVVLDGNEIILKPGESVDILAGAAHRAINVGTEPFVFIEVQRGSYLGEDDIIRLEDNYGRA